MDTFAGDEVLMIDDSQLEEELNTPLKTLMELYEISYENSEYESEVEA